MSISDTNNEIFWDTTAYPIDYPEIIREVYYRQNIINRKSFTSWIGKTGKKFNSEIDWWVNPPVSRNPYISNLFHFICLIKTINELKKKFKRFDLIVESKSLKEILEKLLGKEKIIKIVAREKNVFLKKYFDIFKSVFFVIFIYIYINIFTKKKNLLKDNKKKILIDTFTFADIKNGERLYKGLDKILNDKKNDFIFFVPTFLPDRNFFRIGKSASFLSTKNYVFREHYIRLSDLFYAITHRFRIRKFFIKYDLYQGLNLSNLIKDEIVLSRDYFSTINALINYRFAKRLSDLKISLKKTIDWFENQSCDKGWNLGFRRYFPKITTIGYQGYLFFGQYLNTIPSKEENVAKVIPEKIIVTSPSYIKAKKEFFPKLKVVNGPNFYFNDLQKRFKKKDNIKLLLILTGIYEIDKKLIEWISYLLSENKDLFIVIKAHPILPLKKIKSKFNKLFKDQIKISNQSLSLLLRNTKITISCGPTSGTLESLAYNCYLICPVLEPFDKFNLELFKIPKNNYKLVYSKVELEKEIINTINKKKIPLKKNKIILNRTNNRSIKLFLN